MSKDIYGLEYQGTDCENKKFLNMNPNNNTINLEISEYKEGTNNYKKTDDKNSENINYVAPPRETDVFINNGRRNHLQYLSLQDTPYTTTLPFNLQTGKIENELKSLISGNQQLFNPKADGNVSDYYKKKNIAQHAVDLSYNINGENVQNFNEIYYRRRTYTADGILFYQKPNLYFRKIIGDNEIVDGIIETDTFINKAEQTLYSMLSEQPKCLSFYNVHELINDISKTLIRPLEENLPKNLDDNSKNNINVLNFDNIRDVNISDKIPQYVLTYDKNEITDVSGIEQIQNIQKKSFLKNSDPIYKKLEFGVDKLETLKNDFPQIYQDMSENKFLSNISIGQIVFYWSFDNIYPIDKNIFNAGGNITKIEQAFNYRNKISYLKNIRTSNLLPRVENINIYIRKHDESHFNGFLISNEKNTVKNHWIKILSLPQVDRESYLNAVKISKNKLYSNVETIMDKEIELFDKFIGNDNRNNISNDKKISDDAAKNNRETLGNFLIKNSPIYSYLDISGTLNSNSNISNTGTFYIDRDNNGNYKDTSYNFLPYYFKEYLNKNKINLISRDIIKQKWNNYMTETNFLNVLSDIIESTFDIKIVLVNNAVVDTMEEIMEDGHRLEIDDRNYNTLMFLRMDFSSGYEPSLPNVSLVHDDSGNDILYINFDISLNFVEDKYPFKYNKNYERDVEDEKFTQNSDKKLQYIEYVFIEKENYRLNDTNIDLSGEQITSNDIKLYDFTGIKIDISSIEFDEAQNKNKFKWTLETFDDTYNYKKDNDISSQRINESGDGTFYRITFKHKKTLGFMDISGLDYEIQLWATNEEDFSEDTAKNVKESLIKNPDNFYIIRDVSSVINDISYNDFYDISFSDFKINFKEDISNNFDFDENVYNDEDNVLDDKIKNRLEDYNPNNQDDFFNKNNDFFNEYPNNETKDDFLVKKDEDFTINAIKSYISNIIIDELNITSTLKEEIINYLKNESSEDFAINDDEIQSYISSEKENIENIITNLNIEFNKDENIAKKMYEACGKYKKFKYYIFKIIKYNVRPQKRIKYKIKEDEYSGFSNISLTNKVFIDTSKNFNTISNGQEYEDSDTLLNSGLLYEDIYVRVLNNNIDKDGGNTVPSLFPDQRNDDIYIKIWEKIKNDKITSYFNSEKSILNTLGDGYDINNTDISTNFDLSSNNIREEFFIYSKNNSEKIIYLNKDINTHNKLKLNIGTKEYKILEISKYSENNSHDMNGLGKNINKTETQYLCTIKVKNEVNNNNITLDDIHIQDISSAVSNTGKIKLLDISNIKITNDELRTFVRLDIRNYNAEDISASNLRNEIQLNIVNNLNDSVKESGIFFYIDDISQDASLNKFELDLTDSLCIKNYKLFGLKYIDYFDIQYINFNIEIKNLFGKAQILHSDISNSYGGFLTIDLKNTFNIYNKVDNNLIDYNNNKYEFKFKLGDIYDNNSDTNISKLKDIIKTGLSNNKLRYKNKINRDELNSSIFTVEESNSINYKTLNNFTFYDNDNDNKYKKYNFNEVKLKFPSNITETYPGYTLYDIMNQKFYNLYMQKQSISNKKYIFYEVSGIKINENKNLIYDDIDGKLNQNSVNNNFFDYEDLRGGSTNRIYPQQLHFNNFKNKWENNTISFVPIDISFTRVMSNFEPDISYSLLCQVENGKLINQDLFFNETSIFNKKDDDEPNYNDVKENYDSKIKHVNNNGLINFDNAGEYMKECNIKWIVLNNELYYDLLFDPDNFFTKKNDNDFLLHKINTTLGQQMENNGGLILGRNGKPTGFYLCQLFRREPIHKYVIITKNEEYDNSGNRTTNGEIHAIIDIGSHAYWTTNISVDDFYNNYNARNNQIINGSNQSSNIINELFYKHYAGDDDTPIPDTHYIFNKCWKTSHYNFIKQTKEAGYEYEDDNTIGRTLKYKHYYLFGF